MKPRVSQLYKTLNEHLFLNRLPEVPFEINAHKRFAFRFVDGSFLIGGGLLEIKSSRQFIDEFLHEMIHVDHWHRGVEDHTVNQYHNKVFCDKALAVGLFVTYQKNRGWGLTSSVLPDDFEGQYRSPDDKAAKRLFRLHSTFSLPAAEIRSMHDALETELKLRPPKPFSYKYVCKCPPERGNNVRSGRRPDGPHALDATCNVCNAKFVFDGKVKISKKPKRKRLKRKK